MTRRPWRYRASCRAKHYAVLEHAVAEDLVGFSAARSRRRVRGHALAARGQGSILERGKKTQLKGRAHAHKRRLPRL